MSRQTALTVLVTLLLLGSVLAVGVGTVAAQDNETDPETEREDRDQTENNESDEPTSVVEEVDEDIRVLNWSYSDVDETFFVTLENTGSSGSDVTITEVVDPDEDGSGTFGVRQVGLAAGETVQVEVDAERQRGTVGVMITTQKSLDRGQGTYLQDSEGLDVGLFEGAASWTDVRVGVLAAIVGSVLTLIVGSWYVIAARDTDISEVALNG